MKPKKPTRFNAANNGGLDSRAMLVYLSIGFWEGRKKDSAKTAEVTADEQAAKDAGIWWTRIIPPSATKPIVNARIRARVIHLEYTLPWQDNGFRILPSAMFFKYTQAMRAAETEFRATVKTFLDLYPQLVADAPQRLSGLFKPEFFPKVEQLADKYPWALHYTPLPMAQDFRVDLGNEATGDIRRNIEQQTQAAMKDAMGSLWTRLHESVGKIADKLNDPEGIFRDSLISNIAELCDLLPAMNVTGDAELEKARQAVAAKLAKQDPQVLRSNKPARANAAKEAADILKRMDSYLAKRK